LYTTFSTKINKKNKTKKKFGKNYTSSIKYSGVSSKNSQSGNKDSWNLS
jgi:hypothetical protein